MICNLVMVMILMMDDFSCQVLSPSLPLCTSDSFSFVFAGITVNVYVLSQVV